MTSYPAAKEAMFDLRANATFDLHGHPSTTFRPLSRAGVLASDREGESGKDPLVASACGSGLLDGIRTGITNHGWTLQALAHRTQLPMPMLNSIMIWNPGMPAADAVWWSLELDALAATHGRRFRCMSGRRSSIQLGQIARSLLRRNGGTWAELTRKAAEPNWGGPPPAGADGWGGEDPLCVLDRMAAAGGVAPVLLSL